MTGATMLQRLVVGALLFLGLLSPHKVSAYESPNSSIFVLVDLSRSYYDASTRDITEQTLKKVNRGIAALAELYPPPVQFVFLSISTISLAEPPLCEATFKPVIFCGKSRNICRLRDLRRKFLPTCLRRILAEKPRGATDISGAIDYAVRISRPQLRGPKAMVIVSDMQEDLAKGAVAPSLSLKKFAITLIYRIRGTEGLIPDAVSDRVRVWQDKLRSAGASKVDAAIEQSDVSAFIVQALAP